MNSRGLVEITKIDRYVGVLFTPSFPQSEAKGSCTAIRSTAGRYRQRIERTKRVHFSPVQV